MTGIPEVAVDDLAEALERGVPVFDVREVGEYVAGHVPGAVLLPLGEVTARVAEFPTEGSVYLICQSGGRSGRACEFLRQQGVTAINVAGGTGAWIRSGYDVVLGDQPR